MAIEIVAKPDALTVVAEIGVGQSAVRRVAVALIGITAVNAVVEVADAAPGDSRLLPACGRGVVNGFDASAERVIAAFFRNKVHHAANGLRAIEHRVGAFNDFNTLKRRFINEQTGTVVLPGALIADDLAVNQN